MLPYQLPSQEKPAYVKIEKAFEVEANIIRDEASRRLDFSRRIQALQITLIGVAIAAYVNNRTAFRDDQTMLDIFRAAVLMVNSVFLLEIRQNNYHLALASLYVTHVINRKYKIHDEIMYSILGWESFLRIVRTVNKNMFHKYSFVSAADLYMSLGLFLIPAGWHFYDNRQTLLQRGLGEIVYQPTIVAPFIVVFLSSVISLTCIRQFLRDSSLVKESDLCKLSDNEQHLYDTCIRDIEF